MVHKGKPTALSLVVASTSAGADEENGTAHRVEALETAVAILQANGSNGSAIPQMYDADGKQFGVLTEFDEDEVAQVWYLLPDETWIKIRFSWQLSGSYASGIIYYELENCEGTAYVYVSQRIAPWIAFTPTGTLSNGDIVKSDGLTFSTDVASARFTESIGCTTPYYANEMVQYVGEVVLAADEFTPPFRIMQK